MRVLDEAMITTAARHAARYSECLQAADGAAAILTHAVTADRTVTIPDVGDFTMGAQPTRSTQDVATSETTTSTSYADLATVGPAVTLTPGRTTDQFIAISAQMSNSGAAANRASVAIAGAAAADVDALMTRDTSEIVSARQTLATSVASGATHTMKYKTGAGTLTALNRRISAFTLS